METQVVIIGGGLMGAAIARELSRYKVDVVLVEKHWDVSFGATKSSHGMIYSGLNFLVSMLLKADACGPDWTDARIAEAFDCRTKTVENVRQRFVEGGFEETLFIASNSRILCEYIIV